MPLKCCWIDNRLDMFYVLICITATPHSLASCLIRFSSLHTCFPCTSPRFCALSKVQHTPSKNAKLSSATTSFSWRCTNTCKNHGYNAVPDDSCAGSYLLSWNRHSLETKKVKKVGKKGKKIWFHTYPAVSSRPRRRCVQSLVQIGS